MPFKSRVYFSSIFCVNAIWNSRFACNDVCFLRLLLKKLIKLTIIEDKQLL